MRIANFILGCLLMTTGSAYAADTAANALAALMQQAKYSDGFEARLNVFVTKANGSHPDPFKLAVVGQITANKQRLSIRGISPEAVRHRSYVAERDRDGRIIALENRVASEPAEFNASAKLYDSGLVAWDMFSPWWSWTKHSLEGTEQIAGRECLTLRSVTDDENSAVREVESCVDQRAKLALRTRLFDKRHVLMRTTVVEQVMRKGEAGALVARKLTISEAGKVRTNIDVYAGDDQYEISADTFATLDKLTHHEPQTTK